jgi:hypothetical protein
MIFANFLNVSGVGQVPLKQAPRNLGWGTPANSAR